MITPRTSQKGITLLIAVVVMTIALSISLSLSAIAAKEFSFANERRDSQLAYYAAESGTQCALFWLINYPITTFSSTPSTIHCAEDSTVGEDISVPAMGVDSQTKFDIEFNGFQYKSTVTVTQTDEGDFTVDSAGINNKTGNVAVKLQRGQKVQVTTSANTNPHDIMLVIDQSASINGEGVDPHCATFGLSSGCDWTDVMADQLKRFVQNDIDYSKIKLGQIHFNDTEIETVPLTYSQGPNLSVLTSLTSTGGSNIPGAIKAAHYQLTNRAKTAAGNSSTYSDYTPVSVGGNDTPDSESPDIIILITDGAPDHVVCCSGAPSGWSETPSTYGRPEFSSTGCPNQYQKKFDINPGRGASAEGMQSGEHEATLAKRDIAGTDEEKALIFAIGVNTESQLCPAYNSGNDDTITGINNGEHAISCSEYLKTKIVSKPEYFFHLDKNEEMAQMRTTLRQILRSAGVSVRIIE